MSDKTTELEEEDFFKFRKIMIVARKSDPRGALVKRSGEHRGQMTKHWEGTCFIEQQWELS